MALKKEIPAILITKMYTGRYLKDNIGHEIINLFQADNGGYYLYFNDDGSVKENIEPTAMILARGLKANLLEVVAVATGLEKPEEKRDIKEEKKQNELFSWQEDFIKNQPENDIKYFGVSIIDIFKGSAQQNIYVTYRANEIRIPRVDKRILLYHNKENVEDVFKGVLPIEGVEDVKIEIGSKNLDNEKLRLYIEEDKESADYNTLIHRLIDNEELWEVNGIKKVEADPDAFPPDTIYDICRIVDSETCISNALCYYMNHPKYKELWRSFFREIEPAINLENSFNAKTEVPVPKSYKGGRIDLLLTDGGMHTVVIENKIKSDINSSSRDEGDQKQLDRYYDFVKNEFKSINHHFFIFHPNYNVPALSPKMEGVYTRVPYSKLNEFLNRDEFKGMIADDADFKAFRNVIKRHSNISANAYLKDEMHKRFFKRILELKNT